MASLPSDLPAPPDDGAADHLPGAALPPVSLAATNGETIRLDTLGAGRTILYFYPRTGAPGEAIPDGWEAIPGARGCTAQACEFRDHHRDLSAAGATRVFGVSTQNPDYQREAAERLQLPFALLADPHAELGTHLGLPTFSFRGEHLYRRLTLVIRAGIIEHVFYPVFPPDQHAGEVLAWLRGNSAR
jgi:peroxiredoxin